jgi:hypothetical protein
LTEYFLSVRFESILSFFISGEAVDSGDSDMIDVGCLRVLSVKCTTISFQYFKQK